MKNSLFILLAVFAMACTNKPKVIVEIENISATDRVGEIIEVSWESLDTLHTTSFIVKNEKGEEVPSQIIYNGDENPQTLIFPASVVANSKENYTIVAGIPAEFPVRTFGRQIPERKDDFAWENDRIAFRMYGPALANENPSNGIDIWLKKTENLIVDKFYKEELENGKSYHVDHGEGLDCYKVGHTLGAGGIAPFADGKIWVGDHYTTARVLDSGTLRTTFELTYDSVKVNDKMLTQKIIISLDAGSQLNKALVSYTGESDSLQVAAGFTLHSGLNEIKAADRNKGFLVYAEDAVSDAGVPAGRTYIGVVMASDMQQTFLDEEHMAGVALYAPGSPLECYFGGGWSQWGFDSDADWFRYIERFAENLKTPLKVNVRTK